MSLTPTLHVHAVFGLLAAVALLAGTYVSEVYAEPKENPQKPQCGCYYAQDCGEGKYCQIDSPHCIDADRNLCQCTTKADGLCKEGNPIPPRTASALDSLADAVELYFQAYEVPVQQEGGRVDEALLGRAASINLAGTGTSHGRLQHFVAQAVDAVIGFDLVFPYFTGDYMNAIGKGPNPVATIRATNGEAIGIVQAARVGIVNALFTRNLNEITTALGQFWAEHPDFRPMHTGRLYPHGHAGTEDLAPLDAQVHTLKLMTKLLLLNDSLPLCGNDALEPGEVCDGVADDACNGAACGTNCTCSIIP